ncbi:MAG: trimeric intracellular cation channel family protein [Synechococcus sp.]
MTTIANELRYVLGMLGIVAFAVTAVLAVIPKGIDLFGACVMGVITAVGGGTIRDLILDVLVFWAGDQTHIWVALGASTIAFYANRIIGRGKIYRLMLYLDALGVALFAIQAMQKVMDLNFGLPLVPIVLGVMKAIDGGLLRDVLTASPSLLMSSEVYAIPIKPSAASFTYC